MKKFHIKLQVQLRINPTAAVRGCYTARDQGLVMSFIFIILFAHGNKNILVVIWTVLLCVMLQRIVLRFLFPLLIYSELSVRLLNLININLDVFIIQWYTEVLKKAKPGPSCSILFSSKKVFCALCCNISLATKMKPTRVFLKDLSSQKLPEPRTEWQKYMDTPC